MTGFHFFLQKSLEESSRCRVRGPNFSALRISLEVNRRGPHVHGQKPRSRLSSGILRKTPQLKRLWSVPCIQSACTLACLCTWFLWVGAVAEQRSSHDWTLQLHLQLCCCQQGEAQDCKVSCGCQWGRRGQGGGGRATEAGDRRTDGGPVLHLRHGLWEQRLG